MKLKFWGAAGTVTGSAHLIEADGHVYLLDFGTYQGTAQGSRGTQPATARRPAVRFQQSCSRMRTSITAATCRIWSSAGFGGPIYTTPPPRSLRRDAAPIPRISRRKTRSF